MKREMGTIGEFKLGFGITGNPGQAGLDTAVKWERAQGYRLQGKYKALLLACLTTLGMYATQKAFSQVGIGTSTPDGSAILHLVHPSKGLILSNMTTTQRNGIASPANSLIVFNTDNGCLQMYINSQWQNIFCDLTCSGAPSIPGVITGNASPCINATGISYSIAQISGATSYTWSVPAGATITAGQGTTGIVVTHATTSGNITVTASNNCGTSAAQTLAITLQTLPAQPSAIAGNSTVCQGDNAVAYSVTNVGGVTYAWTYSGTGFTCVSGCATNSITADYSSSATSGTLSVTPSNACGSGTAQTQAITVNAIPSAPTANAATGIAATAFNANWTASGGATTYYLDVATDAGFTAFVTGYNNLNVGNVTTYTVNTNLACATTYYYRLRAGSSCGTSSNSGSNTITTGSCSPAPSCGTQVWNAAAINVGTRINGAPAGQNMTAPGGDQKYCLNDVEANCTTYGDLYEWGEAMNYAAGTNCDPCGGGGVQGICPAGYHMPTDLEWSRYEFCLESTIAPTGSTTLATFQTATGMRGSTTTAGPGAKMKDNVTWNGTNASGFTVLPAKYRHTNSAFSGSVTANILSATDAGATVWYRYFDSPNNTGRYQMADKFYGLTVRCLQN